VAGDAVLARPQTFMNRSGYAVECLVDVHRIPLDSMLIVYDDVALPLGQLRLRPSGSPGGHRGVESIVHRLRSEAFPRLRLGIAPREPIAGELSDFVLSPFEPGEESQVNELVTRAADAAEAWSVEGIEAVMNRFNG